MSWMLTSGALETSALTAHDSVVAACGQSGRVLDACFGVLTIIYVHSIVGHGGLCRVCDERALRSNGGGVIQSGTEAGRRDIGRDMRDMQGRGGHVVDGCMCLAGTATRATEQLSDEIIPPSVLSELVATRRRHAVSF